MAEDIGVGGRAGYYDGIGAARDVIQNHLLQLLALTAMEEPISFDAADLRAEKEKVLAAVRLPKDLAHRHRARPVLERLAGRREGRRLPRGGRDEPRVHHRDLRRASSSSIGTRRWAGVPFYLRAGKRLGRRVTEIAVVFKRAPAAAVRREPDLGARPERARHPRAARRGRDDPLRLEGARRRHAGARRDAWTSATATPSPRRAPRRTSDSSSTCCSATRRCSRVTRRSSSPGRSSTRSRSSGRRRVSPSSTVPEPGDPSSADELLARDGRVWRRP